MTWLICLQLSSSSICRYHSPSVYWALSAALFITPKAAKHLEHFSNAFWQISWNAASLMDWEAFHQWLHWTLEPNRPWSTLTQHPLPTPPHPPPLPHWPLVLSITIIKSVFGTITLLCILSIAYFWASLVCVHTYADTQWKIYDDADTMHSWQRKVRITGGVLGGERRSRGQGFGCWGNTDDTAHDIRHT